MVRIACLLALIAACAVEEPLSSVESSLRCEVFICGDNAASAGDGLLFDELDLFHRPNQAGVKLLGARNGTVPLEIDIRGDRMYARETATGIERTDLALEGTIMKFESPYGEIFEVLIEEFNEGMVSYRAGAPTEIPIYLMKYRRPAKGQYKFDRFVCRNDVVGEGWSTSGRYVMAFRGDRYDQRTKRLIPNNVEDGWSFLACEGSAAAKLHIHRHTYAGGLDPTGPYPTTSPQRQALLKAITSDYCGNGEDTFTVSGNPLTFTAAAPFSMPALAPVATFEAIWGPEGAICLDVARRDVSRIPDPMALRFTRAEIETACGRTIPACGAWISWWPWLGYAITANPA